MSSFKTKCTLLIGAGLVLLNRGLIRTGLRKRRDGWRRGAGLVLREPPANFVLSAFSLNVWSDAPQSASPDLPAIEAHFKARLATFLAAEPETHFHVRRTKLADSAETHAGPHYTLALQPWIDGPARFIRPETWTAADHAADPNIAPLFNAVARLHPDGRADLWLRIHHVGNDGVPMQEVLSRLEKSWGLAEDVIYPTTEEFAPFAKMLSCPGRDGLAEIQTFLDFEPLLLWRKRCNAKLPIPLTVSGALLWSLAHHPQFKNIHIGTTVEVPVLNNLRRCVGLVVIRPQTYFRQKDGLSQFAIDFNRQLELTRQRKSEAHKTLDAAAFLSPTLATTLFRHSLDQNAAGFGRAAVTILKDARVFGASLGDAGHAHGFMAIGSVGLRTSTSQKVGCIMVKGPAATLANYPAFLQEVLSPFHIEKLWV